MPTEPEITRITEVPSRGGDPNYLVEGGDGKQGGSFLIDKKTFHEFEHRDKRELNEMLKRQIQASIDERR